MLVLIQRLNEAKTTNILNSSSSVFERINSLNTTYSVKINLKARTIV